MTQYYMLQSHRVRGVVAMVSEKWEIDDMVTELYARIHEIIKIRGIKWADLARLIGISPKTLSSMKSQKVNPSWTTIRKIANALDVSMDELTYNHFRSPHLYELYWAIPREIRDIELQDMTCNQLITLAYVTGNGNLKEIRHRDDICRDEIHEKLSVLKKNTKRRQSQHLDSCKDIE